MSRRLIRGNVPTIVVARPAARLSVTCAQRSPNGWPARTLSTGHTLRQERDPRIRPLGKQISDDYATIRDSYETPKYPIVLAHGLLGFAEFQLSSYLPTVHYWHGIKEALTAQGATVITPRVPPSSSIADRAAALHEALAACEPKPEAVNIIAHSMGGLDARYMLAHISPAPIPVASLVTIATPHRGSAFADYLLEEGGEAPIHLPRLYGAIERAGFGTAAFAQLTQRYMQDEFNPATQDSPDVRYFSYGAAFVGTPPLLSPFRYPHSILTAAEGPNDGLVSVESSRWGTYKGTLLDVSHLDLINWSNRVKWTVREWIGMKRNFNAIAFYLDMADMLAKEGL
ncbi:Alpha/Beta hydrolase protein [Dactylonectria macrodidyma]|uniref:Alpha/Beta hydrolase protein n=1 Tax=Dactylonectria macrodidyma TaxID=307937 RepID=A0A9P9J5H3_9HYPO|nr:Alpha/Beta hydrolase protein [Dactylonectria macrodidyma]